ncbi:MAG: sodium-dependent transporter [Alphaproteobacteria bacterium]|nr:sodium-dependent transporter [Alphaproteobacteria bacterium]
MTETNRAAWGSKLGIMLASAGSAVGLGNLWRFPFCTAQNGGGSFLIIYLICSFTIGAALVFTEAALGMKVKSEPSDAFGWIHPRLKFIGGLCILTSAIILPYYNVVGGWILAYIFKSFSITSIKNFGEAFTDFSSSAFEPLLFFYAYMIGTAIIVYMGIQKGIEKFCKIMMPVLFVLLIVLMIRVLMLDRALEGVKFFFLPDISKLNGKTMLDAMGQVFFSVSVGMGVYITYGSYVKDNTESVSRIMWPVVVLDVLISLLAGLTIFPAVFSFNIPINAGPALIFITLPKIFASLPFGQFFGLIFFIILLGAAATSSISLMEVPVAFLCDRMKFSRPKAVVLFTVFCLITGTFTSLSFGKLGEFKIAGKILFDQFDFLASNILLPLGGFLTCIAVGWILGSGKLVVFNNSRLQKSFEFCIKWIAPIAILLILLKGIELI